jgi:ribonuclease HII
MLKFSFQENLIEAGCDEAGRGCLAGPVYAAAVILPHGFQDPLLNDSKKMTEKQRNTLRIRIENEAVAWSVAFVTAIEIDEINILNA